MKSYRKIAIQEIKITIARFPKAVHIMMYIFLIGAFVVTVGNSFYVNRGSLAEKFFSLFLSWSWLYGTFGFAVSFDTIIRLVKERDRESRD